ncbi:MAG: MarR family transcriptional regulator [Lachnospiraceae bacterium]|nr:MarR family transcriptional regulator [Lachnospiraceae bacterium]
MQSKEEPCNHNTTTHRMIAINHLHRRTLERNLKKIGIHRAQHRLLMNLASNPSRSQMELAKRLDVSPATVAVSLKSLVQQGMIRKTAKQEDNRFNSVELTEEGRRIVEESREFFNEVEQRMYQGFSPEEMADFCGYLERMYNNMAEMEDDMPKNNRRES